MSRTAVGSLAVATLAVLAGCSALAPAVPKCSDSETLDLVRDIIVEGTPGYINATFAAERLRTALPISLAHATRLEENIKKYSCQATLDVKGAANATVRVTLDYTSQLDDDDNHLVHVGEIDGLGLSAIQHALGTASAIEAGEALAAEELAKAQGQSVNVPPASEPPSGPVAETEGGDFVEEEPARLSPEQAADREGYLAGQGYKGSPKFSDYPAGQIYSGPTAPLDMRSETARSFRTRLREALTYGDVVTGGEFTAANWGCGTSCNYVALISKRTGIVVEDGFGGEYGPDLAGAEPGSNLLIGEGPEVDDDYNETGYFAYYFELKNGALVPIGKVPIAKDPDSF